MFWLIWIRISSRLRDHPPLYRDSNDGNWCLSSSLLLLITTAVVYLSGHHHMLSRHTLTMHSLPRTMQSTRRMHRSARSGNLWAKTQQPSGTQIPLLPKEHLFLMLFCSQRMTIAELRDLQRADQARLALRIRFPQYLDTSRYLPHPSLGTILASL